MSDFSQLPPGARLGDQPIQEQYREKMTRLAATLDKWFNDDGTKQTGFVLLVFPFNTSEGRCNYISNGARRQDVVRLMKEQIARFEGDDAEKKG